MEGIDYFRAIVRWIHAIAAVVWVGGSIFYLVALRPAMETAQLGSSRGPFEQAINKHFRPMVDFAIIGLIITGIITTVDRLQSGPITTTYYVVLGLKIATALSMFVMARDLGVRGGRTGRPKGESAPEPSLEEHAGSKTGWRRLTSPSRLILILGLLAFFLSMVLVHVYESEVIGL